MSQQLARLTDVSFKTFKQQKTSRMWAQNSWKVFRVVFHCPLSGARRLFVQTGRRLQEFLVMSAGVCLWFYIWWQIGGHLGKRQLRLLIILSSSSTHCSLWIRRDPDYKSKLTEVCSTVWFDTICVALKIQWESTTDIYIVVILSLMRDEDRSVGVRFCTDNIYPQHCLRGF